MNNMTEERVDQVKYIDRKDFMKQVGIGFGAIMLMNCLQSCSGVEIPDPDPNPVTGEKLDITLDLNTQSYQALNSKGGYVIISDKKVIVAQTTAGAFIAVSSVCTHQGTTILFQPSSNIFKCPKHGSEFTTTGAVKKGPAGSPLKKYNVSFDQTANTLRIFE